MTPRTDVADEVRQAAAVLVAASGRNDLELAVHEHLSFSPGAAG